MANKCILAMVKPHLTERVRQFGQKGRCDRRDHHPGLRDGCRRGENVFRPEPGHTHRAGSFPRKREYR